MRHESKSCNLPQEETMERDLGSFRDRKGRIFYSKGEVFRALSREGLEQWEGLSSSAFYAACAKEGKIIMTEEVEAPNIAALDGWQAFLKHERVPFISYPYEWPFGMLKDAALLQLDLAREALQAGLIIKDASAYNVQWMGTKPVFIDVLSFEKYKPGDPWVGYQQFCRLLLYPLMLNVYKGIAHHAWLRGVIDGIDPGEINKIMSLRDLFRPGVLTHVFLQAKFQQAFANTNRTLKKDLESAGFGKEMILRNIEHLSGLVRRLKPKKNKTSWSEYASRAHYAAGDLEGKKNFVEEVMAKGRWKRVWDLGCNDGMFSRIAAKHADYVVAMDADTAVIDRLYQSLKSEESRRVLPLVVNLADTASGLGWRGRERKALDERGRPDFVLCLALIHHMVIGANIPVREFIEYLSSLCQAVIIEFVTKDDPMVKILLRNKADQYDDYALDYFEKCLSKHFEIRRQVILGSGTRKLYYAVRM